MLSIGPRVFSYSLAVVMAVCATGETLLADRSPHGVCSLEAPTARLSYDFCGCRTDLLESFRLNVSGFPFQHDDHVSVLSVAITPRTVLTGLRLRTENVSFNLGEMKLRFPGSDVDVCSSVFPCPLAANVPASYSAKFDMRAYEEWTGFSSVAATVKFLDLTGLEVIVCFHLKLDLP
jgi:hypothetical protein